MIFFVRSHRLLYESPSSSPSIDHPTRPPIHFSGNLRPIAAPAQLGTSTSEDPVTPTHPHVPCIPSSLDDSDSDCSSAPAPPPLEDWDSWEPWQEEQLIDMKTMQHQAPTQLELYCQEAPVHPRSMQGPTGRDFVHSRYSADSSPADRVESGHQDDAPDPPLPEDPLIGLLLLSSPRHVPVYLSHDYPID